MKEQQENSEVIEVIFEEEVDLGAVPEDIFDMFFDAIKRAIEEESNKSV